MTASPDSSPLTLYSARLSWVATIGGFGLFLLLVVAAAIRDGLPAGTVVLAVALAAALVHVLRSIPVRAEISAHGVKRVCPLRRQTIPWDEIDAFERLRRSRGLVVRTADRKRRVVCDRCEGRVEYEALQALVAEHARGAALPEEAPIDRVPTFVYRRRGL